MYGMSDRFGMMCLATVQHQYLDGGAGLICGEDTAAQIDQEVLSIINNCYEEAVRLLVENREVLDKISEYLYEKETITGKEFMKMFREMKGLPDPEDEKKEEDSSEKITSEGTTETITTAESITSVGETAETKEATETKETTETEETVDGV